MNKMTFQKVAQQNCFFFRENGATSDSGMKHAAKTVRLNSDVEALSP